MYYNDFDDYFNDEDDLADTCVINVTTLIRASLNEGKLCIKGGMF